MPQHRFRTAALVGLWRPTREQACRDALNARQCRLDGSRPDGVAWAVPGEIEADQPAERRAAAPPDEPA
jgi:hypothetical protein